MNKTGQKTKSLQRAGRRPKTAIAPTGVWTAPWIGRWHQMFAYDNPTMPAPLYRREFTLAGAVREAIVLGSGWKRITRAS